jgi:transaldolase/glucose-6-phosphate isomerase
VIGLDLALLLDRAEGMKRQCVPEIPAARNPGLLLGTILGEAAIQGRDKLTLLVEDEFGAFGSWVEQLVAESSGKNGKGIVPVDIEPPIRPSAYSHDRLFVYLRLSGQLDDRAAKLRKTGAPVIELQLQDEYDLAGEFYRWEVATATACAIIGVNGFDQPDVQDSKNRTSRNIANFKAEGKFDEGTPIWKKDGATVYGTPFEGLEQAGNVKEIVDAFLCQARDGDFEAINAYLPRNTRTLAALQGVRKKLLQKTGKATTLGFGPRFLHSTGQLHKGGANNGLFLQITADPVGDFEIPTEGVTFGTLERAQALGDLEALLARGRRAIRIHLADGDVKKLIKV